MIPKLVNIEDLPIIEETIEEEQPEIKPSFLFDYNKGDFILENGKLVKVTGVQALKIWIEKVLRTELDRFKVYQDKSYGINLEGLIGSQLPQAFVESELEREITETLTIHPMIDSITDFELQRESNLGLAVFSVNLVDGDSFDQEVPFDV